MADLSSSQKQKRYRLPAEILFIEERFRGSFSFEICSGVWIVIVINENYSVVNGQVETFDVV